MINKIRIDYKRAATPLSSRGTKISSVHVLVHHGMIININQHFCFSWSKTSRFKQCSRQLRTRQSRQKLQKCRTKKSFIQAKAKPRAERKKPIRHTSSGQRACINFPRKHKWEKPQRVRLLYEMFPENIGGFCIIVLRWIETDLCCCRESIHLAGCCCSSKQSYITATRLHPRQNSTCHRHSSRTCAASGALPDSRKFSPPRQLGLE